MRLVAGDGAERGRRAVAQPETRARVRALRQLEAGEPAREIGADVEDVGRPFLERDQRIERRHAVRLGGRDLEAPAHVAERALRHPPDAPLRRAKCGQEEMPPRAVAARHAPVVERGNADHGIDRLALGVRRLSREQAQVRHLDRLHADRSRLELRRARLGILGVDRQHVRRHLVGEVQVHEREPRPQRVVVARGCLDRAAA